MKNERRFSLIWLSLLLFFLSGAHGLAQTNSGSYLDTIYSAGATETQEIGRAAPARAAYRQMTDKELIDDIHRLLNELARLNNRPAPVTIRIVSIKDAKPRAKTANSAAPGRIIGKSVGTIKVKTLPAGSTPVIHIGATDTRVPATSVKPRKTPDPEAIRRAAVAADKAHINNLKKRFGIEILGGISGDGGLWNSEQLRLTQQCLQTLPASFISSTKQIARVHDYMGRKSVLGYVYAGVPKVHICDYGVRPVKFEETIVHEMAHVWMFDRANAAVKKAFVDKFWPNMRRPSGPYEGSTSSYGGTSAYEDFAEAVRYYWQNCPKMKQTHPQRWAFINRYVFKGKVYPEAMKVASTGSTTLTAKVASTQPK